MGLNLLSLIPRRLKALCHAVKRRLRRWTKPDSQSLALNAVLDLSRSQSELVLENALLRRQVKRPALTWGDRAMFVLIARRLPTWKTALIIVQADTLLRLHRDLFRRVWRGKSRRRGKKGREPLAEDIVNLIENMAKDNRTWGAEWIRRELLKLGKVAKSTIEKNIYQVVAHCSMHSPSSKSVGQGCCETRSARLFR
jgi:putative transposase